MVQQQDVPVPPFAASPSPARGFEAEGPGAAAAAEGAVAAAGEEPELAFTTTLLAAGTPAPATCSLEQMHTASPKHSKSIHSGTKKRNFSINGWQRSEGRQRGGREGGGA